MRIFIALAAAIAATSVSFAVATAANQPTPVAQTSATDRAVVKQLNTLNRSVNTLNRAIGTSEYGGLRNDLRKTADATEDIERTMGSGVAGKTVMRALADICENTAQYSFDC